MLAANLREAGSSTSLRSAQSGKVGVAEWLSNGEGVVGEDTGFGGYAEETAHAFDALFVEDIVNVVGEVGADGAFGDGESAGPLGGQSFNALEAVDAGLDEICRDALIQRTALCNTPDCRDEGEAGEGFPLVGEVVVDELFAGALEAVGTFFEGEQGGITDDDCGVGLVEHGVEVGGHGQEWDCRVLPLVEEDAGVGDGGAAGGVCGNGAEGFKRLVGAADQEQGTDAALGGDGAAGQNAEAGRGGEGGDGDEADVGGSSGQALGAFGGGHAVDLIFGSERGVEGRVFEVPHEGGWVQEADGGYAETSILHWVHSY